MKTLLMIFSVLIFVSCTSSSMDESNSKTNTTSRVTKTNDSGFNWEQFNCDTITHPERQILRIINDTIVSSGKPVLFFIENQITELLSEHRAKIDNIPVFTEEGFVSPILFQKYLFQKYGGKLISSKKGYAEKEKLPIEAIYLWLKYEEKEGNLEFYDIETEMIFWKHYEINL